MSKHEAMVEYLKQYPGLRSFLHFNTITDKSGNVAVQTVYGEEWEKRQLRGHGIKRYDFALVSMVPQDPGTSNANVAQMENAQAFMEWVTEQNRLRNFPQFEGCKVLSIENLQNMPNPAGVNAAGNVAKLMCQCRVRYYE